MYPASASTMRKLLDCDQIILEEGENGSSNDQRTGGDGKYKVPKFLAGRMKLGGGMLVLSFGSLLERHVRGKFTRYQLEPDSFG